MNTLLSKVTVASLSIGLVAISAFSAQAQAQKNGNGKVNGSSNAGAANTIGGTVVDTDSTKTPASGQNGGVNNFSTETGNNNNNSDATRLASCADGYVNASSLASFTACASVDGNDTGADGTLEALLESGSLFSIDTTGDWTVFGKSDENSDLVGADEKPTGEWSALLGADFYGDVTVSLKSATGYYAYLFEDVDGSMSGSFALANGKDLSHMTIAIKEKEKQAAIPEPFSMLAAGLALGAGKLYKSRKK